MLTRIGQIAINVQDPARAVAFYRDVLGLTFLFQAGDLAFFDCGGIRLMLSRAETKAHDHPASVVYYAVPDIQAAYETLGSRGVAFESPPHVIHRTSQYELRMAFLHDSEGNMLALMHEQGTL